MEKQDLNPGRPALEPRLLAAAATCCPDRAQEKELKHRAALGVNPDIVAVCGHFLQAQCSLPQMADSTHLRRNREDEMKSANQSVQHRTWHSRVTYEGRGDSRGSGPAS